MKIKLSILSILLCTTMFVSCGKKKEPEKPKTNVTLEQVEKEDVNTNKIDEIEEPAVEPEIEEPIIEPEIEASSSIDIPIIEPEISTNNEVPERKLAEFYSGYIAMHSLGIIIRDTTPEQCSELNIVDTITFSNHQDFITYVSARDNERVDIYTLKFDNELLTEDQLIESYTLNMNDAINIITAIPEGIPDMEIIITSDIGSNKYLIEYDGIGHEIGFIETITAKENMD